MSSLASNSMSSDELMCQTCVKLLALVLDDDHAGTGLGSSPKHDSQGTQTNEDIMDHTCHSIPSFLNQDAIMPSFLNQDVIRMLRRRRFVVFADRDTIPELNFFTKERILSELADYGVIQVVKKFKDADSSYKQSIRDAFGGTFTKFVNEYMDKRIEKQLQTFKELYKNAKKKDLLKIEEQLSLVSELEKWGSARDILDQIDLKATDNEYKERVKSAFGFNFDKFRNLCAKALAQGSWG